MNILIILLIAFLLIAPPAICEDNKVIVSYPTKEGVYYTESQPNVFQLKRSGDYEVLAYIKPVTEKKKRIFNAHEVDLTKVSKKKGPPLKTEITNEGLLILNRPKEGHLAKDEIKFNIPLPEQGISIEEYPLFQIRYQELNPLAPLNMGITFHLDTDEDGEIDTTAFAKVPEAISGKLVKSIDFSKADLIPKSYSYILCRKLGIKMDEKWRYVQDGENVVIQRRFYENLREVPVIKLFFDKESKVNRINFMVDFNNNEIPDATIEFERTIYRSFSKGELQGIEVNLLKSVKRLFPKKKDVFLTEIFIFVEGNKENILKEMPLKRLGFYQTGIKEVEGELLLVKAGLKEEEQGKCLTIDLSEIEKEGIYSARIKEADLALEFSQEVPSGVILKKIKFYDSIEEDIPTIFDLAASITDKRAPLLEDASEKTVVMPEMITCDDFTKSSPVPTFSNKDYQDSLIKITPYNTQYRFYRTDKKTDIEFYFNGDVYEEEALSIDFPFMQKFLKGANELEIFNEVHGDGFFVYMLLRYRDHRDLVPLTPGKAVISFEKLEVKKPLVLSLLFIPKDPDNTFIQPVLGKFSLLKMVFKSKNGASQVISFGGKKLLFPMPKSLCGWKMKAPPGVYMAASGLQISYSGKEFPNIILEKDLNIEIDKESYFWCDYDALNLVPYLKLVLQGKGKRTKTIFIPLSPRIFIKLDDKIAGKKIEKMAISLKPVGRPFDKFAEGNWGFNLKRIEIFRITPLQKSKALTASLPPSENLTPLVFTKIPSSSTEYLIYNKDNKATIIWHPFSLSPLNLNLKCETNKKIEDILYLSFKYKADPDLLKLNPHWLKIRLGVNKSNGKNLEKLVLTPHLLQAEMHINIPIKQKILEKIGKENGYLSWVDFNISFDRIPAFKSYQFEIRDVFLSEFKAVSIKKAIGRGKLVRIDDHEFSTEAVLDILSKNSWDNFLNGGAWLNLGKFFFSQGEHEVEFAKHKYLKIDTLLLKGEAPISATLIPSGTPKEPLSERVLGWGLKTIFLGFIFFCLYLVYRFRRLYLPFWNKFDKVWSLVPIWTKVVVFPALGLCLYVLGLKKKVGQSENYLFTLGGIFLVLGYHYLSLLLKPWWLKHHEGISAFIYRSSGSIYIIGFMAILIIAAFFLVFGIEPIAEQVAVIGYYLLVVGVIKEFLAFRKSA